jgi:glycosyltransferase involved in cell wall biosynthesis
VYPLKLIKIPAGESCGCDRVVTLFTRCPLDSYSSISPVDRPTGSTGLLIAKFTAIQPVKIHNNKSEGSKAELSFAFVSSENPRNKRVWSGTLYTIYKQLMRCGEVEVLGPHKPQLRLFMMRAANQLFLLFGKRLSYRHSSFISKAYGNFFRKQLQGKHYDYIVAPAASAEIAFLTTDIPIIYITDGTFAGCLNYHKSLTNLTGHSLSEGNLVERLAISKSYKVIVSSYWAHRSVVSDYNAPADKVHVIPYGANFDKLPDVYTPAPFTGHLRLLFVGVYWQSKGGDIAWRAFSLLREKGLDVSLTIVGCIPPPHVKDEKLNVIPFIDKNAPEGMDQLAAIYKKHHILLLPTRFDCTPIAINEASAFGIPSLVARTGGVEGHLKQGENGYLFDYDDKGEGYATCIEELMRAPERFTQLQASSRKCYENLLNWDHWREKFMELITA